MDWWHNIILGIVAYNRRLSPQRAIMTAKVLTLGGQTWLVFTALADHYTTCYKAMRSFLQGTEATHGQ